LATLAPLCYLQNKATFSEIARNCGRIRRLEHARTKTDVAVSIILPTYNERANVPILVDRLAQVLSPLCSFEVLVVDDNSPDGTWALAEELSKERPWLRSIRRMHNKGLSPAVVDGFTLAKGERLIVMDADLQHDENALSKFLDAFNAGASLVVGSRKVEGGGVEDWSVIRRFVSWFATRLAHFVLPLEVTDPMSGFFGINRALHEQVTPQVNPKGFKILLEYIARTPAAEIREVGYTFRGRQHGESKLSNDVIYDYLEALWGLSKFSNLISWRFLNYFFVGCVGMVVNLSVLGLLKHNQATSDSLALIFAVESSIISNFFLNNSITFRKKRFSGPLRMLQGLLMFNAICATGAFINHSLAMNINQAQVANIYFSTAMGYLIATVWNYVVNAHVCWKMEKA
jgi:dolichol-phosphate mannosyltransferase